MAEEQCNLLKNGGGNSVRLRATVTNSGSQTRADLVAAIYSAVVTGYANDNNNFLANAFLLVNGGYKFPLFYVSGGDEYRFIYIAGTAASMVSLEIYMYTTEKSVYSSAIRTDGTASHSDISNTTGWNTIELYY